MISYLIFVYLFAFASCEAFHANQHLPVQKYQPPAQYQPAAAYQQYIPIYTQPLKSNYNPQLSANQIEDLQRQYQQWQIGYPQASQSGQAPSQQGQPAGQPGVVWISAPQYSYYPPPPNSNYPPQQYPPPPPNNYPPPPYPSQSPGSSQYPPPSGGADPSATRQTGSTSAVSQPGYEQPSTPAPESYPSSSESSSTEYPSSSYAPSTESSSYYPPETQKPSTEEPYPSLSTDSGSNYPSSSTEYPSSSDYPSSSSSSGYPSQNETTSTTYKPEQNGTGNSTNNNPLLKYCKEPRGQFASDDCRKFVNCWDEVAVEQACPNGLVFNEEKHYCDYPSNVDCGNRTSGSNSSSPGNGTDGFPPKNPACPDTYGTYRNKSNCAAFYVCVQGEPVDFNCPPGTVYNDDLKVCDYPYRTDCKGAPTIPAEEQNTTETSSSSYDNSSSSESSYPSSSSNQSYPSTSTNYPPSSSSESNSSPYYPPSSTTTDYPASSTVTIPPAPVSEYPSPPPPGVDPVGSYNYNLKKLPESIVNTGVRCYHSNVFRLTPDCSSVTVCQDGLTYIVNCGSVTSFDAYEQRCVPSFRARC